MSHTVRALFGHIANPVTLGEDICLSGGADGADLAWGMVSGSAGHSVIHWTFASHKSQAPAIEIVMLTKEQLSLADPYCHRANLSLKRSFPPRSVYVGNLLRRDWYQVETAQSCYAVSSFYFLNKDEKVPLCPTQRFGLGETIPGALVEGGTAWAVQLFIDKFNGAACPCYVFDQEGCNWFEWKGVWTRIYEPPKPKGIYAGVGTRKLNGIGKLAIRVLMDYRQDFHAENYPMLRENKYEYEQPSEVEDTFR